MSEAAAKAAVNPVLDVAAPVLSLVAPLRTGQGVDGDLRSRVMAAFDQFERAAYERQVSSQDMLEAKFALAASIDEAVLASSWSGRMDWMSRSLQMEMFGEHLAGEEFFRRLNRLRDSGESALHLLELYYICLQLGFEGVYKLRGLEQLHALQVDLRAQIDRCRGRIDPVLAPGAATTGNVLYQVGRQVPYWVIAVVTVASVLLAYLSFGGVGLHATTVAVEQMDRDRRVITGLHADRSSQGEEDRQ